MRILYVSQYFPPEMGAPAARVYELSRCWTRMGHRVTVLTGFPNHPSGQVRREYRAGFRRGTVTEEIEGIRVVRTWLYPAPNRFASERIINYASFFLSAGLRGLVLSRPDVVIGTSPQLLVGLAGWWLARRFRRPFVLEVRDLWPESLPASGVGHPGSLLYRALGGLAGFLYRAADRVVVVTEGYRDPIVARGDVDPAKVVVIENGVDVELFRPIDGIEAVRDSLGFGDRFVVSYIGTLGFAHGLDTALSAAAILRERLPRALFVFVGDGAERERLEGLARSRGLENVRFIGQQPRELIPRLIAASDICLVLLRDSTLFRMVLPSKMLEFMACARPVLIGVDGVARRIVEESGSGVFVRPEDPADLARAVVRLHEDSAARAGFGENGRRWIARHFTREGKSVKYLRALEGIIAR